jgi:hypothetical protein
LNLVFNSINRELKLTRLEYSLYLKKKLNMYVREINEMFVI